MFGRGVKREILEKRKAGKFVIKASVIRHLGNPFSTSFPRVIIYTTYILLDTFTKADLPKLKIFAAERFKCKPENIEISIMKPFLKG